jgi:predicted CoA-binding protein
MLGHELTEPRDTRTVSTYRIDKLFSPRSVAVVGASPRATSPGGAVLKNLRAAGFEGSLHLVNPHYGEIAGIKAVKTVAELPRAPDLMVIATPPQSLPGIVTAAGEKGAASAIIITAGLGHGEGSLAQACERPHARPGCGSLARTASACSRRAPGSMPASPPACRRPATSPSSRNRAPSPRA